MNLARLLETQPVSPACSLIVTIPARNEKDSIEKSLTSLALQANCSSFHVVVFANNCDDSTAEKARRFATRYPQLDLSVAEGDLQPPLDHVGTARKMLMDYAADHFHAVGIPSGIIATTDADTCVASDWIGQTLLEMQHADAVAGLVEIEDGERRLLPAPVRDLYAQENAFRRAWAELESLLDPRPEDPFPRHCSFVAASFAVTAAIYRRAGGLPDVPALEDRMFLRALRRVDARVRFSPRVRAATSGRHDPRVEGGFGTLVKHLHLQGTNGETFMVENPGQIVDELKGRAAFRKLWAGSRARVDVATASEIFGIPLREISELIDETKPFGQNYEAVQTAAKVRRDYPLTPVGEAIEALHAAAAELKAAAPTRMTTASGAG
ncbi:MAG TPA: glycosyltransferase [Candidatus Tumulicola sp.]